MKLFLVFCLVGLALSRPFPEGGEGNVEGEDEPKKDEVADGGEEKTDDAPENDAQDGGNAGGGAESSPKSDGGDADKEVDPVNTYNQVVSLLDKCTKVDSIENSYLQAAMASALQSELRNKIIESIRPVGDYDKIADCFKSMDSEVKKVLDQETKSFEDCKSKEGDDHKCSEDSYSKAKTELAQLSSKITSCVSSGGSKGR